MKPKYIEHYMNIAELTAQLSYAQRRKVGSIIVKNDQIIGAGYNGLPAGWENSCEHNEYMDQSTGGWLSPDEIEAQWPFVDELGHRYRQVTKPEVIHSEMNAISKVARSTESTNGATMFCTAAPCIWCAKAILQSGISTLYFRDKYRDEIGINFLIRGGINVHHYRGSTEA